MLLFYIRIFAISRWRIVFWVALGLNVASMISVLVAALAICHPLSQLYQPVPGGYCGNQNAFELFTAVWSLLADAAIVVLPMPILWSLQMNLNKKIGLSVVFGMGTFICILTLVRIFISHYYDVENITKQSAIVILITGLEPTIGIIVACLPFVPAIIKHSSKSNLYTIMSQPFRSSKGGSHSSYGHSKGGNRKKSGSNSQIRNFRRNGRKMSTFEELNNEENELETLHEPYEGPTTFRRDYEISGGVDTSPAPNVRIPPKVQTKDMRGIQVRKDMYVSSE